MKGALKGLERDTEEAWKEHGHGRARKGHCRGMEGVRKRPGRGTEGARKGAEGARKGHGIKWHQGPAEGARKWQGRGKEASQKGHGRGAKQS
jgi:hypothetical protein